MNYIVQSSALFLIMNSDEIIRNERSKIIFIIVTLTNKLLNHLKIFTLLQNFRILFMFFEKLYAFFVISIELICHDSNFNVKRNPL